MISETLQTRWESRATTTRLIELVQDFALNNLLPSPSLQPTSSTNDSEREENWLIQAYFRDRNGLYLHCLQSRFGRSPSSNCVRFAILLIQADVNRDEQRYDFYLRVHHHFLQKAIERNSYEEVVYSCLIAYRIFMRRSEFDKSINYIKGFLRGFQKLSSSAILHGEETAVMGHSLAAIISDLGLMIRSWNGPASPLEQLPKLKKLADLAEGLFQKSLQSDKFDFYGLV
jgi:hypothetical protein